MKRLFAIPMVIIVLLDVGVFLVLVSQLSWNEILTAFSSSETLFALRLSTTTSISAVFLSFLLGVPAAYLLARESFFGKRIIAALLDLSLIMPPLVTGMGLLFLFGEELIGGALRNLGLKVVFTPWGAVAAQAFIALPVLIRSCRAAFETVDPKYEQAGATLGLSPFQVFFLITLPMAKKGVLSAVILAWARAMGEFGATLMVAGATLFKTATLPISVYLNISSGEIGLAISCSWLLLLGGIVMILALNLIGRTSKEKATA
jgi:molybdate transport system permease protein